MGQYTRTMEHQVRPPIVEQKQRSWWERNWKWAVPGIVMTAMTMLVTFIVAIFILVFSLLKSSDVYKESVAAAKANPEVVAALGTPIEEGFLITGQINISGQAGDADLAIPLSGPNGAATVYVEAHKSGGSWYYTTLSVALHETGGHVNLIQDES